MNKIYHIYEENQQLVNSSQLPLPENYFKVQSFLKSLPAKHLAVVDLLLIKHRTCKQVYPSQISIAQAVGVHPSTVCRILGWFEELGFFTSKMGFNSSKFYYMHKNFKDPFFRSILSPFLMALKGLSIAGLMVNANLLILNVNRVLYKTITITVSHTLQGERMKQQSPTGDSNPIPESIRNLKIPLSKWGQIKLTPFSDEVIEYLKKEHRTARDIKQPFEWCASLCNRKSKELGVIPNWPKMYYLEKVYGYKEGMPLVLQQEKHSIGQVKVRPQHGKQESHLSDGHIFDTQQKNMALHEQHFGMDIEFAPCTASRPDNLDRLTEGMKIEAMQMPGSKHYEYFQLLKSKPAGIFENLNQAVLDEYKETLKREGREYINPFAPEGYTQEKPGQVAQPVVKSAAEPISEPFPLVELEYQNEDLWEAI